MKNFFFLILLFIISISAIFFFTRGIEKEKVIREEKDFAKKETVKFKKTKLQAVDKSGNMIWEISSDDILTKKDEDKIYLSKAEGVFYEDKKIKFEFKVNALILDNKTKDLKFKNFSGMSRDDKIKLSGSDFFWNNSEKKLYCFSRNEFVKENIKITSDYTEIDAELKYAKMKGNTITEITLNQ